MIFGYTRISTLKDKQTTQRQVLTLNNYASSNNFNFDQIVEERVSGTIKLEHRNEYSKLKSKFRRGDILVLTDLDRLGRNADDVILELKELKSMCIRVIALDMPYMCDWNNVNNNSSMYDMIIDIVITIKAHIAQQEREKCIERINQGLAVAKAKGKKLGRPNVKLSDNFVQEYNKFKNGYYGSMSATSFAKMLGIGRSTLYKYISIYNKSNYF